VVFSTQGQLVVGREVLIYDEDAQTSLAGDPGRLFGDLTGLTVTPEVTQQASGKYISSGDERPHDLYPSNPDATLAHMVAVQPTGYPELVAAVFPAVRGVVVYDDAVFARVSFGLDASGVDLHRVYLRETARPYYINGSTGDIIRGPLGGGAEE